MSTNMEVPVGWVSAWNRAMGPNDIALDEP